MPAKLTLFQFRILGLMILTVFAAIVLGVVRLAIPVTEKIAPITMLFVFVLCWRNRNYLHPQQANISYNTRCRVAILDFFGPLMWLPLACWTHATTAWKQDHVLSFADFVLLGATIATVATATYKLVRAVRRDSIWKNSFEIADY